MNRAQIADLLNISTRSVARRCEDLMNENLINGDKEGKTWRYWRRVEHPEDEVKRIESTPMPTEETALVEGIDYENYNPSDVIFKFLERKPGDIQGVIPFLPPKLADKMKEIRDECGETIGIDILKNEFNLDEEDIRILKIFGHLNEEPNNMLRVVRNAA